MPVPPCYLNSDFGCFLHMHHMHSEFLSWACKAWILLDNLFNAPHYPPINQVSSWFSVLVFPLIFFLSTASSPNPLGLLQLRHQAFCLLNSSLLAPLLSGRTKIVSGYNADEDKLSLALILHSNVHVFISKHTKSPCI